MSMYTDKFSWAATENPTHISAFVCSTSKLNSTCLFNLKAILNKWWHCSCHKNVISCFNDSTSSFIHHNFFDKDTIQVVQNPWFFAVAVAVEKNQVRGFNLNWSNYCAKNIWLNLLVTEFLLSRNESHWKQRADFKKFIDRKYGFTLNFKPTVHSTTKNDLLCCVLTLTYSIIWV